MKDSTLEKKLRRIVDEGKPTTVSLKGERKYASKKILKEIKDRETKEGGIFPLIPLFAAITAASAVAGGSASIANAVNSKKISRC